MRRTRVESSNIRSVAFRRSPLSQRGTLEVQFATGSIYKYYHVPIQDYRAVVLACSPGSALYHVVKTKNYEYRNVKQTRSGETDREEIK